MDHDVDINIETDAAQITSQQQTESKDTICRDDTTAKIEIFTKMQDSLPNKSPSLSYTAPVWIPILIIIF